MGNEIIFKRKIYDKILEWKNSPLHNSALLIEGARRIGKSTIVEKFAKDEFGDNYIMIDFRKEGDDVKKLFNDIKNLDAFFSMLFLSQNKVLKEGGLIIFDEIHFCPKARECIKDFVQDGRFYFIETGSLISIKENTQDIMIPSEERRINMYPMDFEEFLWAYEDNKAFNILKNIVSNHENLDKSIHGKYLEKFRTYMVIGGMPKVLSIFLETNSFKLANDVKLDILELYRDDLRKYDKKYDTICGLIFDSIPTQLAKTNKRFVIKSIKDKERYNQISKSLDDLCDFKIINRINGVSTLEAPLGLKQKEDQFKLYFCDTGLLFSKLIAVSDESMNEVYFKFIIGKKIMNMGSLFESIVVQQLVNENLILYFHKYQIANENNISKYELDLVTEKNFKVFAFEIKSSKTYTTSSLDNIKKKYPQLKVKRYVLGIKNLSYDSDKITLPIYLANSF